MVTHKIKINKSNSDVHNHVNTFNKHKNNGLWFVKYYADWCPHCTNMQTEWNRLENNNLLKNNNINTAEIEESFFDHLLSKPDVVGFPTIKLYRNGISEDFKGDRTSDNMVSFLQKNTERNGRGGKRKIKTLRKHKKNKKTKGGAVTDTGPVTDTNIQAQQAKEIEYNVIYDGSLLFRPAYQKGSFSIELRSEGPRGEAKSFWNKQKDKCFLFYKTPDGVPKISYTTNMWDTFTFLNDLKKNMITKPPNAVTDEIKGYMLNDTVSKCRQKSMFSLGYREYRIDLIADSGKISLNLGNGINNLKYTELENWLAQNCPNKIESCPVKGASILKKTKNTKITKNNRKKLKTNKNNNKKTVNKKLTKYKG